MGRLQARQLIGSGLNGQFAELAVLGPVIGHAGPRPEAKRIPHFGQNTIRVEQAAVETEILRHGGDGPHHPIVVVQLPGQFEVAVQITQHRIALVGEITVDQLRSQFVALLGPEAGALRRDLQLRLQRVDARLVAHMNPPAFGNQAVQLRQQARRLVRGRRSAGCGGQNREQQDRQTNRKIRVKFHGGSVSCYEFKNKLDNAQPAHRVSGRKTGPVLLPNAGGRRTVSVCRSADYPCRSIYHIQSLRFGHSISSYLCFRKHRPFHPSGINYQKYP